VHARQRRSGHDDRRCAFGQARFVQLDGLEAFCTAAGKVNDAADPVGLALYSGIKAEPLAAEPPARAMQLLTVLRELRGSAHLVAVRANGLDAKTAHYISRPDFFGMFGWGDDEVPTVGPRDRAKLEHAEKLTDRLVSPAYSVLRPKAQKALLDGLEQMEAALA